MAGTSLHMLIVGQDCKQAPYITVYLVVSLPKTPYMHRVYMVLANPRHALASAHRHLALTNGHVLGARVCMNACVYWVRMQLPKSILESDGSDVSCYSCNAKPYHQGWPEPYIYKYIYTIYIRYFWQGHHHICSHIRCIYKVLANPTCHICEVDHLVPDNLSSPPSVLLSASDPSD